MKVMITIHSMCGQAFSRRVPVCLQACSTPSNGRNTALQNKPKSTHDENLTTEAAVTNAMSWCVAVGPTLEKERKKFALFAATLHIIVIDMNQWPPFTARACTNRPAQQIQAIHRHLTSRSRICQTKRPLRNLVRPGATRA